MDINSINNVCLLLTQDLHTRPNFLPTGACHLTMFYAYLPFNYVLRLFDSSWETPTAAPPAASPIV